MKATFLSRFTPSMMTPEALEATFVQRKKLAKRLEQLISESVTTQSKHQMLLVGPRGIGKTHLVSLTYHRLKELDTVRDRLLIAWLREEEWGVTSFLDLILRILRALIFEYQDSKLGKDVEGLYSMGADAAERKATQLLKNFIGDRVLLVLAENLDDLFSGLAEDGQKRLRSYVQENPLFIILATSQSLFNGISLQTSPFYGFFRIYHLDELKLDEATRLLSNIAKFDGDAALATFINTPAGHARIRAIHHLAGGNHRVYVIFSQFLTRESLDSLIEPFMRTLDDLTPYYQARMAWLSPQQRKFVELLYDRRSPIPVKEIAQKSFVTHQTASSQLKILRDLGYVRSIREGRESYYELREPLMRLCFEVKKHRGQPVMLFVEFLRLWYSQSELRNRLETLHPESVIEREYLRTAIKSVEHDGSDPIASACLSDFSVQVEKHRFKDALKVADELIAIRGSAGDWLKRGFCLHELERYEEAMVAYEKSIELNPNYYAWSSKSLCLSALQRHEEALQAIDKALELDSKVRWGWVVRGEALDNLERFAEGTASYEKAIEIEPTDLTNVAALVQRCHQLDKRGLYDLALKSIERAIDLNPNDAHAWFHLGIIFGRLGEFEKASSAYARVVEIRPSDISGWGNQGIALSEIGRWSEALACFDRVIELNPRDAQAWRRRGTIFISLDEFDEALISLNKAIELEPDVGWTWRYRALALDNLGKHDDALTAIEKAIEVGERKKCAYFNRAELLVGLGRWNDAKTALDEALGIYEADKEHAAEHSSGLISNLIRALNTVEISKCANELVELYQNHRLLPALTNALVRTIPIAISSTTSDDSLQRWQEAWSAAGGEVSGFEIPMRILSVAASWRDTKNDSLLLQLPIEERKLLEPLLKIDVSRFTQSFLVRPGRGEILPTKATN